MHVLITALRHQTTSMKNNHLKPIKLYFSNSTQCKSVKIIYRLSRYIYDHTHKEKRRMSLLRHKKIS